MKRLAILILVGVLGAGTIAGCTAAATAEFSPSTLTQLQQLNHKPELYITGGQGDFLITADTRVEIFLTGGEVVTAFASQVLTNADSVILKGTGQVIPMSAIARVRYTSTY